MGKKIYIIAILLAALIFNTEKLLASTGIQDEFAGRKNMGQEQLDSQGISQFKDSYIPKQYHPLPEYLVFVDLGVLILLLIVGLYLVLKRKSQKSLSLMAIITFTYLGFIRGGCVCPVGAISNTTMGVILPYSIGLATLIVFLVPLIIALISGRVFCTSGCPLGAVQHLMHKKKKTIRVPKKLNQILKIAPVIMLIATVYYAFQSTCFLICQLEPYKVIFFTGQIWFEQVLAFIMGNPMEPKFMIAFGVFTWIYLIAILVLGYWVPRPFCRFLCPYGVLLGVVSIFSFKQREINKETCVQCGRCAKICPTQAITVVRVANIATISNYDCIQCNKCNDICNKDSI